MENAKHTKEVWKQYFRDVNPEMYKDDLLKRQVKFAHILGSSALDESKLAQVSNLVFDLENFSMHDLFRME